MHHLSLIGVTRCPIMEFEHYQPHAISLGLGLLVGLQREWKETDIAGIRTFRLITMLGTLSVILRSGHAGWLTAVGLLAVDRDIDSRQCGEAERGQLGTRMTTDAAALLMYAVGAALGAGYTGPSVVTGGVSAVLLHWKKSLHAS